jgi:hypothetical protein
MVGRICEVIRLGLAHPREVTARLRTTRLPRHPRRTDPALP